MAISVEFVLSTTIDFIRGVVEEYKAFKEVGELKDKLDLYVKVLEDISNKFAIINNHLYVDLIPEHKSAKSELEIINNELMSVTRVTLSILNWFKLMEKNKLKQAHAFLCPYFVESPTKMVETYTTLFEKVKNLLEQVNRLIDELYGTTMQFKNEILRKCWILCGKEFIVKTTIPKTIFTEAMRELVKITYTNDFNNHKTYILNAILMFVDKLDGCTGIKPDEFISKFEINEYSEKLHSNNLNDILGIDDKIKHYIIKDTLLDVHDNKSKKGIKRIVSSIKHTVKETTPSTLVLCCASPKNMATSTCEFDNMKELCEPFSEFTSNECNDNIVLFDEEIHVTQYDTVIIPPCSLTDTGETKYGSDWPSKVVLKYTVEKSLSKIRIKYTAYDQGYGGTGHASVRYQINAYEPVPMNFLKYNRYEENRYLYDLNEALNIDDVITIYIVCPVWNGWSATIKYISFQLYDTKC